MVTRFKEQNALRPPNPPATWAKRAIYYSDARPLKCFAIWEQTPGAWKTGVTWQMLGAGATSPRTRCGPWAGVSNPCPSEASGQQRRHPSCRTPRRRPTEVQTQLRAECCPPPKLKQVATSQMTNRRLLRLRSILSERTTRSSAQAANPDDCEAGAKVDFHSVLQPHGASVRQVGVGQQGF